MSNQEENQGLIEGRNAVLEALRANQSIDKILILDTDTQGALKTIIKTARQQGVPFQKVPKERLNALSSTGKHQGVMAYVSAYEYTSVDDIVDGAISQGKKPFLFLLDGIDDPHNLGAIIRTANMAGADGVVIPKRRAVHLTATVVKASAGAINYTPVAKVTNMASTIDSLKEKGMWFVCADLNGDSMYDLDLSGSIGLVIGSEGEGVSRLVREKCDMVATIPTMGDIDSLNASVAAGILGFEIARQRTK